MTGGRAESLGRTGWFLSLRYLTSRVSEEICGRLWSRSMDRLLYIDLPSNAVALKERSGSAMMEGSASLFERLSVSDET
jgi:hypothetical protein